MRLKATILAILLAGCTTDFDPGDEDTGTEPDTALDTTGDTQVDTGDDTGVPDLPEDSSVDTSFDTEPTDTWTDPGYDPGIDTEYDPGIDTEYDPVYDSGTDPSTESWIDGVTCVSATASLGGTCNIMEQCGCLPGERCIYTIDPTLCDAWETCAADSGGTGLHNDPCDYSAGSADCAPGYNCVYDSGTGICVQWCLTDADCMEAGTTCSVDLTHGGCGTGVFAHLICY